MSDWYSAYTMRVAVGGHAADSALVKFSRPVCWLMLKVCCDLGFVMCATRKRIVFIHADHESSRMSYSDLTHCASERIPVRSDIVLARFGSDVLVCIETGRLEKTAWPGRETMM